MSESRLPKLPAGVLERRIRDVCVDWLSGEFVAEDPLTVQKIRLEVERRHERPVSYNGVLYALKHWGTIGAADIGERPVHFVDFTNAARTEGFKALKARYKEQSRAERKARREGAQVLDLSAALEQSMAEGKALLAELAAEPEYRQADGAESLHWSDLEAYVPDAQ